MTSAFLDALKKARRDDQPERWFFVAYDQLSLSIGPWADQTPESTGLILVESAAKGSRRPYHVQKLALLLTSLRHFAVEAAQKGYHVHYMAGEHTYVEALREAIDALELEHVQVMRPAEHELRAELAPLHEEGLIEEVEHDGWLTSAELFTKSQGKRKSWLMRAFYKRVREQHDIMMDAAGDPVGGKLSFDEHNREPWSGEPEAPSPPTFEPDAITREVGELVEARFGSHPGTLDLTSIAASHEDLEAMLDWVLDECMTHFGPYEDAMSTKSHTLFHSLLSPYINLHRITPRRVLDAVLGLEDIPLQSKEGFVRQLIGWREFMHHVHAQTDGLRELPHGRDAPPVEDEPGDAGWADYSGAAWSPAEATKLGGAAPNLLGASNPLPDAFWGEPSGMFCLDHVVQGVMETGWSHHIERLMILSNLATLLDVAPRELTDWFWSAYIDAYDWVVEPNVLGMGTFGLGNLFTTKPYVAGSNYINKMSDFCSSCELSPRSTCPITNLYWAFLARHEDVLGDNPRMGLVFNNLSKRDATQIELDAALFDYVSQTLARGEAIDADGLEAIRTKFED